MSFSTPVGIEYVSVTYSNIFLAGKPGFGTVQIPTLECTVHVLLFPLKQDVFLLEDNICFVHSEAQWENCMLC